MKSIKSIKSIKLIKSVKLIKSNQVNEIKSIKSCAHKKTFKYYLFYSVVYLLRERGQYFFILISASSIY